MREITSTEKQSIRSYWEITETYWPVKMHIKFWSILSISSWCWKLLLLSVRNKVTLKSTLSIDISFSRWIDFKFWEVLCASFISTVMINDIYVKGIFLTYGNTKKTWGTFHCSSHFIEYTDITGTMSIGDWGNFFGIEELDAMYFWYSYNDDPLWCFNSLMT